MKQNKNSKEESVEESSLLRKFEESFQKLKVSDVVKNHTTNKFLFWDTQPVPKISEEVEEDVNEAIDSTQTISNTRAEPYPLPDGFLWTECNFKNDSELREVYMLLSENYVEDDDASFRFNYTAEFLRWALQPPGWHPSWLVGVRVAKSNKLVAFISAVPALLSIYDKEQKNVEVNFLCVHKKLRSKRLAPVLIKEITRRVNLQGVFQAAYTAGTVLPRPVAVARYFHRALNVKKLVDVGFIGLSEKSTLSRLIKVNRLPDTSCTPGFRQMRASDIPEVRAQLIQYLKTKYKLFPNFSEEELMHYLMPVNEVMYSYVVESPQTKKITDFVSFYYLPTSVLNHQVHKSLRIVYLYYYFHNATSLVDLMRDTLVAAKNENMDVFNCLTLMENTAFIGDLNFGAGDGVLNFYLYNWKCASIPDKELGLVLL